MASAAAASAPARRSYVEEVRYLQRITPTKFEIKPGFVPNMRVPGYFYVNSVLEPMMFEEVRRPMHPDATECLHCSASH